MSTTVLTRAADNQPLRRQRRSLTSWLILVTGLITVVIWVFPLWMSVATALKDPIEVATTQPWSAPHHLYLNNFTRFWEMSGFGTKLRNSVVINIAACAISVVLSFLNAVALQLGNVRRSRAVLTACMIAFAIPQEALVFPVYKVAKLTHTYGSILPLIVILGVLYSALGTFLLGEVMRAFPRELIEAAHIDGAGIWRVLTSVVLPILRPTLLTLTVMVLIWDWNEYMMPLMLLPGNDQQTIPVAIASTFGPPGFNSVPDIAWGAAGVVLSSAPTVLIFLVCQRVIARGITIGTD